MKKLFSYLVLCALVVVGFTSCDDKDTVNLESQKIKVGINVITASSDGLVVKNGSLTDQGDGVNFTARANTPACVKTLTIESDGLNGLASKTFTFTDVINEGDVYLDNNERIEGNVNSLATFYMSFWGGNNNGIAYTTSLSESASLDPVGNEQDGISSNVTSFPIESKTNSTIYGVDQDINDAFFVKYPLNSPGALITYTSPIQEDVKYLIRSIPPFAEFAESYTNFNVTEIEKTLILDMETKHSRMLVTARFDGSDDNPSDGGDVSGGYTAEFVPIFNGLTNVVSNNGNTCPARTVSDNMHQVAWFVWSNEYSVGGTSIDFNINIYNPDGSLLRTVVLVDVKLMLAAGKDIWVDIVIPATSITVDGNIIVNYGWENEDREITIN